MMFSVPPAIGTCQPLKECISDWRDVAASCYRFGYSVKTGTKINYHCWSLCSPSSAESYRFCSSPMKYAVSVSVCRTRKTWRQCPATMTDWPFASGSCRSSTASKRS